MTYLTFSLGGQEPFTLLEQTSEVEMLARHRRSRLSGQETIHVYPDQMSQLHHQDELAIERLKNSIARTLIAQIGTKDQKAINIVQWLPSDNVKNLQNIQQSLVNICQSKASKDILKQSLHFGGLHFSDTALERLKIRAAILYSLSWTDDSSPKVKYTNHLEEISSLFKCSYSFFRDKYTDEPAETEMSYEILLRQLSKTETEKLCPALENPSTDDNTENQKEKAMMYLWMHNKIKELM